MGTIGRDPFDQLVEEVCTVYTLHAIGIFLGADERAFFFPFALLF